jgi:hypothetical protein
MSFWRSGWWTEEEYLYLRDKFSGFSAVAAHRPGDVTMHEGDGPARLVPGIQSSAELFDVLGAQPMLGRTFRTGDDVGAPSRSRCSATVSGRIWAAIPPSSANGSASTAPSARWLA